MALNSANYYRIKKEEGWKEGQERGRKENVNRSIASNEIESVIKKLSTNISPAPAVSQGNRSKSKNK